MKLPHVLGALVGVLIAVAGLVAVADPGVPLAYGQRLQTMGALYAVAAVRVLMGVLLAWAARGSRVPRTLLVIGALMILGGLVSPFFGVERVQELLAWFSSLGPVLTRASAGVAALFGAFIVWAVRPTR